MEDLRVDGQRGQDEEQIDVEALFRRRDAETRR